MKLLFFDIDGTLLSEKTGEIPMSAKEAIKKAQANGHLAFINTGRPRPSIDQRVLSLGMDGYVCGCGSYIEYHQKVLHSSSLSIETCREIVQLLKKYHISALLEGSQGVYYEKENCHPKIEEIKKSYAQCGFDISKTWDDKHIQFDKATCWINEQSNFAPFLEIMSKRFEPIQRADDFYEFIQSEYSKATGIQFLLDYFHLTLDDAYAFGDSTNDLSMLQYVKHSIAMADSHPEVLKQASLITKDVDDDGIAYALAYLHLI